MTLIGVRVGSGRSKLELLGGNLAPRVIRMDATGARVALVATTALLLGGDHVHLEVDVGPGAWLEVIETAGTVAHDAGGQPSNWTVRAQVGPAGLLLWHGEPLVIANGANTLRRSTFDLDDQAGLCVRETVVLGRTGETGGALRVQSSFTGCGMPLLREDLDLREDRIRRLPGIIGRASVIDSVTTLGAGAPETPALPTGTRFDLDSSAGTVGRVLRTGLAGSPADQWWSTWSAAARHIYRSRNQ